jgi:hypothetical protein
MKFFIMLFQKNSCYDQHGTMILYDTNMFLSHTFSKKNLSVEFFIVFFSENTRQTLYIIVIYKPPQMNVIFFHFHFRKHSYKNPYKLSNHNY